MFGSKTPSPQDIEAAIRRALGEPDWLLGVEIAAGGKARLVVAGEAGDPATGEARRLEAESAARGLPEIVEAEAVLAPAEADTASQPKLAAGRVNLIQARPATPAASPPPTRRVRKGARLSDEALRQGDPGGAQAPQIPGISRILVVASAKGGVGKSTVAVNLAAALARTGMRVGLMDADIYGPSIPTMLGTAEAEPATNRQGKLVPIKAHGLETLSIGYLSDPDAPMIWRGPIVMSAITQMLNDAAWGTPEDPLDILIMDTPPGTGDAQLTLAQRVPVTAALLVTTPQEVALADVRRGAAMFAKTAVPVLGLVETMSWFEDPTGARHYLMGEGGGERMARNLGLPLLAQLPMLQAIREGGDTGEPAALTDPAAGALFATLAREVALAIDALQTKPPPEIVFED